MIDEPDYDQRLEGFSEAKQTLPTSAAAAAGGSEGGGGAGGATPTWTPSHVEQIYPAFQTALHYLLQVIKPIQDNEEYSLMVACCFVCLFACFLFVCLQCSDMSIRDAASSYVSELIKRISPEGTYINVFLKH